MGIIEASEGDRILIDCFKWRFGENAPTELAAFEAELSQTALPFDLKSQLRVRSFPGYPSFEVGMPDAYYYFVPNTGWGSVKPFPNDCLDPNFVYCIDGNGLNLGCPLRLHAALARASELGRGSVPDCLRELKNSSTHLAAVEELLWADIWAPGIAVSRALPPNSGRWYDWDVDMPGTPIKLEVKFHKSDWPRVGDPHHLPIQNKILANAAGQLTETGDHFNVVGITLMESPRPNYVAALETELITLPKIDAVILKSFAGEISVFSLTQSTAAAITAAIDVRPADQFQLFYTFIENIAQKNERRAARPIDAPSEAPSQLFHAEVQTLPPRRTMCIPALPYRLEIESRNPVTDEPHFRTISPFL